MARFKPLMPLAAAAALAFSFVQPAAAADGTINFTGQIVATTCDLTAGAGTNITARANQSINVDLGKVSTNAVGAGDTAITAATPINVKLDCSDSTGLTSVDMRFDPSAGSGIDAKNPSLLAVTGGAKGVGIGLYDESNKLLNLAAGDAISAPLTTNPDDDTVTAQMHLRARYVANGDAVTAGQANGQLPFTLIYK